MLADGDLTCWGANRHGELGDGTLVDRAVPAKVPGVHHVVGVATGMFHTCAVLASGSVLCWGTREDGELGDGVQDWHPVPTPQVVAGVSGAVAITAGYVHTCVLLADKTVECWGGNDNNPPPVDGTSKNHLFPAPVPDLAGVTAVRAAIRHTCALIDDGTVKCWGSNFVGNLGDGSVVDHVEPEPVTGVTNAVAIDVGVSSTCAVLADGSVQCWGGKLLRGSSGTARRRHAIRWRPCCGRNARFWRRKRH